MPNAGALSQPAADRVRIQKAQSQVPFKLAIPARVPIGARLMAVVVTDRSTGPRTHGRLAEFGLVLVGPPYTVHTVIGGSPADRAGVQPGDRLLEIDERKPESLTPEGLLDSLKLRKGQPVHLTLRRAERTVQAQIVASPRSSNPVVKQACLTYSRGSSLLMLTEFQSPPTVPKRSPGVQTVGLQGASGALTHDGRSTRLQWVRSRLLIDLSAPDGGFTDEELISLARSLRTFAR